MMNRQIAACLLKNHLKKLTNNGHEKRARLEFCVIHLWKEIPIWSSITLKRLFFFLLFYRTPAGNWKSLERLENLIAWEGLIEVFYNRSSAEWKDKAKSLNFHWAHHFANSFTAGIGCKSVTFLSPPLLQVHFLFLVCIYTLESLPARLLHLSSANKKIYKATSGAPAGIFLALRSKNKKRGWG